MAAAASDVPGVSREPAGPRLDRAAAESLARTLRAVADPTRLQLLSIIRSSPDGEATSGELAERIGLRQPTISHHLRLMSDDGLVVREQRGKFAWYSVAPDRIAEIDDLLG
ncbi:metalloregulator ArsR/SmtB family transcription factor [Agromyces sp. H66]|uniref:ArsR/SmtB family transcription factor n=1 Tax=Agromyces sp. H66 TaxID=2529859 RepID=UPI0010AAEA36|nr:metalloregulator ArsR/SmtB family transcription factor [Agromyces sp. H66]